VEEESVIHFLAKTWYLWWMLADVLILMWFHALTAGNRVESLRRLASEEEAAYIASWKVLRKAHAVSFSLLRMER
jgi:hypothetical protein